jgi:hypothetical protein
MVAICPSSARPSSLNNVSRTNGRRRMVGSTQSVVIGSWLGGWSGLVSRFGRRPQPRHRRKNRVPGQRRQELAELARWCWQRRKRLVGEVARSAGLMSHERENNRFLPLAHG